MEQKSSDLVWSLHSVINRCNADRCAAIWKWLSLPLALRARFACTYSIAPHGTSERSERHTLTFCSITVCVVAVHKVSTALRVNHWMDRKNTGTNPIGSEGEARAVCRWLHFEVPYGGFSCNKWYTLTSENYVIFWREVSARFSSLWNLQTPS